MKKLKQFIIKTKLWCRGTPSAFPDKSALRLPDGRMCCLGHLGVACQVSKKAMTGIGFPDTLSKRARELYPEQLRGRGLAEEIGQVNDGIMPMKQRKARLRELFAKVGLLPVYRK